MDTVFCSYFLSGAPETATAKSHVENTCVGNLTQPSKTVIIHTPISAVGVAQSSMSSQKSLSETTTHSCESIYWIRVTFT